MTVAHDAATESIEWSTTPDPFTFSHTPSGTPRGVLVFVAKTGAGNGAVSGITYGGVALSLDITNRYAADSAGENGSVFVGFLGSSIPTGTQTVSIDHTGGATLKWACCVTVAASSDTELGPTAKDEGDQANPQAALDSGATSALRYAVLFSGHNTFGSITNLANMTAVHDHDFGTTVAGVARQTTASTGSFTIGFTAATEDTAAVYVAIQEVATGPQDLNGVSKSFSPAFSVGGIASTYSLAGSLFTKAPTFSTGAITATRDLAGVLFQNTPTFSTGTITTGAVNLDGVLFTKAPTFFTGAATANYPLTGSLFTKAPTFSVGVVVLVQITDPTEIANLAVWFKADSLSLSDNDPVTTWEDSSPNNRDASQATSGNKPLYKTNQRNSLPAVRFDGTDDWLEVASLAATFSGSDLPITIFVVLKSNIVSTPQGNIFTLERSTTSQPVHEWLVRNSSIGDGGVLQSIRRGDSGSLVSVFNPKAWLGNAKWCIASDVFSGTLSTQEVNGNRYTKDAQNVVAMTVDRATIGFWRQAANFPFNGDIGELVIYSRALTEIEQDSLGEYLSNRWDLPWGPFNPATPETIPTPDASNQAIAPSVIYFPSGWNGSDYWMGFTPYTGGDSNKEEPCIVVSDDGVTWAVPAGGSNPITADPVGDAHFADSWITYDPVGDTLYLFYIHTDESTFQRLVERHSTDGITWSAQATVLDLALDKVTNPSVVYDPGAPSGEEWKLWYTEDSPTRLIKYRTSSSPASGYSAATTVVATNPFASTRLTWQQNVMVHKHGPEYVMYISDGVATVDGVAYVGKSADGIAWDFYPAFIADREVDNAALWDSDTVYGGCFLRYADPVDGGLVLTGPNDDVQLWYAARDLTPTAVWQTGFAIVPRNIADLSIGAISLFGDLFQNPPTFFQGAITTGVVNLAGLLYQNTPVFGGGVVNQLGGPQLLGGTLFQKAPTFSQGAVTSGLVDLAGVLFQKAPTFFAGVLASSTNLSGVLFQNTPVFPLGVVAAGQAALSGVLYQNTPAFPPGSIGVSGDVQGVLYQNVPVFFTGSLGQLGGSFWRPNPAGYTLNPAAFDPVLRNEVPPWAIEIHGDEFELEPAFFDGSVS